MWRIVPGFTSRGHATLTRAPTCRPPYSRDAASSMRHVLNLLTTPCRYWRSGYSPGSCECCDSSSEPLGTRLLRPSSCVWEIRSLGGPRAPARSRLRGTRDDTVSVPGLRAARREEGDVHYAHRCPALDAHDVPAVVLGFLFRVRLPRENGDAVLASGRCVRID